MFFKNFPTCKFIWPYTSIRHTRVLNSTLKKWSKSVLPRVDPKAEWWLQQPCSATASFWRPEIKAVEASRPASGGWRTAKATKWCQALLFNVSSRHHLLGRYRAISFRATFRALIWRVFSRLDFFSRHISCSHLTSFFPVRFFLFDRLQFRYEKCTVESPVSSLLGRYSV